jgi:hypothetical protein
MSSQKKSQQLTGITTPQEVDILCGSRGAVGGLRHRGNQVYRELVHRKNRELHTTSSTSSSSSDEQQTNQISKSIVVAIRKRHGRFLQMDDATKTWFDIGDPQAIEKTTRKSKIVSPDYDRTFFAAAAFYFMCVFVE